LNRVELLLGSGLFLAIAIFAGLFAIAVTALFSLDPQQGADLDLIILFVSGHEALVLQHDLAGLVQDEGVGRLGDVELFGQGLVRVEEGDELEVLALEVVFGFGLGFGASMETRTTVRLSYFWARASRAGMACLQGWQ